MASLKGIKIKIEGETSDLTKSLNNVKGIITKTNDNLRELNRSLKFDPKNTETLATKQKVLAENIEATKEKLKMLRMAQEQMGDSSKFTEEQKDQYRNLSVEIANSESALVKLNKELDDTKNGDLTPVNKEMENMGKTAIRVGDIIKANLASEAIIRIFDNIKNKISGVASSIKDMTISGGINRALNIENAKAKMSTFTKSTEQLDEIMKNVADSVDGTAFSLDSMATVASGLFATGIKEGDEMTRILKLVGDTAQVSGRGVDEIGAIFNKISANGKITGEELNQLSDSGIPILQMLSDSTGKSVEDVRKLVSAGKIGFKDFADAMEKGLGGAAQKSGETFTSSLANLKSALSRIGAEIMTPLLEGITPVMNQAKNIIKKMVAGEDISEDMTKLFSQLETFVGNAAEHLNKMIDKYIPVISQFIQGIIQMIPTLLPKIIPVIVNLISKVAQLLFDNLPTLVDTIVKVGLELVKTLSDMLPTLIPQIVDCILKIVEILVDNIDLLVDAGIQLTVGLIEGLTDPKVIDMLATEIPFIIVKIVDAIIRNLPKILEAGGRIVLALGQGIISFRQKINAPINQLIENIKEKISGLRDKAVKWGKDMLSGFIEGIKSKIGQVGETAKSIANKIKSFLHFSKPDLGPLRDYETWMPDMIKGLVNSIKKNSYLLENAMENMTFRLANKMDFTSISDNTNSALKMLKYGVNNSLNPLINPNANNNLYNNSKQGVNNNVDNGFTAVINNNSKYTSPADNVRLLRQEYELYKLKYGGNR